jgi:hypothetical protein
LLGRECLQANLRLAFFKSITPVDHEGALANARELFAFRVTSVALSVPTMYSISSNFVQKAIENRGA